MIFLNLFVCVRESAMCISQRNAEFNEHVTAGLKKESRSEPVLIVPGACTDRKEFF